jgi:hypothetical protein
MNRGLSIEVIWFDEHEFGVRCACANRRFSGITELHLADDDLLRLVETLRGFPRSGTDKRQVRLGTTMPNDGCVSVSFYCTDSAGHAVAEVKLRAEAWGVEPESVTLRIPIEAAGIDSFLAQLVAIPIAAGARYLLPMAT